TVALAVWTPPQTTPASPTISSSPEPVTSTSSPASVVCVPVISSGLICPSTTWGVSTVVSSSASVPSWSMVASSTCSKASSIGAKTVYSPLLSVSTRSTSGFTSPETACTSVVSSGLLEAAVATGSCAMPSTEPGPSGLASAYSEQPAPTIIPAGSAIASPVSDDGEDSISEEVIGAEVSSDPTPPASVAQPASTRPLTAAAAAADATRREMLMPIVLVLSTSLCTGSPVVRRDPPPGWVRCRTDRESAPPPVRRAPRSESLAWPPARRPQHRPDRRARRGRGPHVGSGPGGGARARRADRHRVLTVPGRGGLGGGPLPRGRTRGHHRRAGHGGQARPAPRPGRHPPAARGRHRPRGAPRAA